MKKITLSFVMMFCAIVAIAQTNLLVNGDFSGGSEGWTLDPSDDKNVKIEDGRCLIDMPGATTKLSQAENVAVVAGEEYTLSFEYKCTLEKSRIWSWFKDASGETNIYLTEDSKDDPLRTNNGYLAAASDWTTHTVTFTAPAGSASMVVQLRAYKTATTEFRNVQLVAGDIDMPSSTNNSMNDEVVVYSENSELNVVAVEGSNIQVYSITGVCLYNFVATESKTVIKDIPRGMLIVKVDNKAMKVMNK